MRKIGERASLTKGSAESDPSADGRPQAATHIQGFRQDEEGHWVAELSCGHTQHLRHQPPWQNREWVQNPTQRLEKIGQPFRCGWCAQGQEPLTEQDEEQ
ncbi:MAG: DUF3565 domain-containing protein [Pseudomonas sp.]|uniref:DUF3565 domain-containing protein n=1 Tax=Pseudomonas sp. TaxID=306 RepID=UPI0030F11278